MPGYHERAADFVAWPTFELEGLQAASCRSGVEIDSVPVIESVEVAALAVAKMNRGSGTVNAVGSLGHDRGYLLPRMGCIGGEYPAASRRGPLSRRRQVQCERSTRRVETTGQRSVSPIVRAQMLGAPGKPVQVPCLNQPPCDVATGPFDIELARGRVPEQVPEFDWHASTATDGSAPARSPHACQERR